MLARGVWDRLGFIKRIRVSCSDTLMRQGKEELNKEIRGWDGELLDTIKTTHTFLDG